MSPARKPPRLAVAVASSILPADEREEILGDLEEEFGRRLAGGRWRAAGWYWGQVGLFCVSRLAELRGHSGGRRPSIRSVRDHDNGKVWEVRTMIVELAQAIRRLRRDGRFSASIVLVLGVGIGTSLVAYAVVDRVLLRPLPYGEPDRLALMRVDLGEIRDHPGLAMAEVADLRALDGFAGAESARAEAVSTMEHDGRRDPVLTARVSPGLFDLLGVAPQVGRVFDEEEGQRRWSGAILSHAFWRERLGADPDVVGTTLRLDGNDVPVLGIMPAGFALHLGKGADVSSDVEVWLPLRIDPDARNFWGYRTVARLADGVSFESLNASLEAYASGLREAWPDVYGDARLRFVAHPLRKDLLRDVRPAINIAIAGVVLLLLVSLANAASLMLGRQRAREANLAVRSALGAGRARLLGVVLAEAFVVSVASGLLGVGVAVWGLSALRALHPPGVPRWGDLGVDVGFFGAAMVLALLGTLVTGLYPAAKVSAASMRILRGETLQAGSGANSVRRSLVGLQMAIAVVLVFAGTVLGRSALRIAHVDLGFDPSHALTLAVPTDPARYDTNQKEWAFHRELRARILALPGVVEAGAVSHLPLAGYAPTDAFSTPTADTLSWDNHLANYFAATPGYLESIAVEVRQGRTLEDLDLDEGRPVAVVDESLAAATFPGESALGRTITPGWGLPDLEIVGIIRHPRVLDVRAEVRPQIYVPYTIFGWAPLHWVVRSEGDPQLLAPAVRAAVDGLGAGRAVFRVRTLESYLADATSSVRMTLTLILLQAALTAILAALGLFTVIAYMAYQARRDTAVRSALGATREELLGHHMRKGVAIMGVAIPAGLALALLGSRLIRGLVYGVSAADGWSIAVAVLVTGAVGVLATYLPARSAAGADPMEALRSD